MSITRTKFMVVSLPRTGTKSLLQMAKRMGLEVSHAPGPAFEGFLDRADIIADTPAFRPSIFVPMVEENPDMKFIYITKRPEAWVESMIKVGLSNNYNNMYKQFIESPETLSPHNMVDLNSLKEIIKQPFNDQTGHHAFTGHWIEVTNNIPADRLLRYDFEDGWEPLAEFLDTDVPVGEVPHLNKDTMFDNITG